MSVRPKQRDDTAKISRNSGPTLDLIGWGYLLLVSSCILLTVFDDIPTRTYFVFLLFLDVFLPTIVLARDRYAPLLSVSWMYATFLGFSHLVYAIVLTIVFIDDSLWLADEDAIGFAVIFIFNAVALALCLAITLGFYSFQDKTL
jgi:hypothetical protein